MKSLHTAPIHPRSLTSGVEAAEVDRRSPSRLPAQPSESQYYGNGSMAATTFWGWQICISD